MSRDDLHFRLRIPEDLKKKIEAAAEANRRSMTSEIVHRLTESFEFDEALNSPEASFDAMKPVFEAVQKEVVGNYDQRFAAIEALLTEVNERMKTTYYPPLPQNTKTGEDEQ